MRILFIGDIVGKPGRDAVQQGLSGLVDHHQVDLVVANVENAAAGFGITREIGDQLLGLGVDVMTSGNHIWDRKEAIDYIGTEPRLLRPANFPAGVPGRQAEHTADPKAAMMFNEFGEEWREIGSKRNRHRGAIVSYCFSFCSSLRFRSMPHRYPPSPPSFCTTR